MADAGYDVWILNARGNRYSRAHVELDPDLFDFWRFRCVVLCVVEGRAGRVGRKLIGLQRQVFEEENKEGHQIIQQCQQPKAGTL